MGESRLLSRSDQPDRGVSDGKKIGLVTAVVEHQQNRWSVHGGTRLARIVSGTFIHHNQSQTQNQAKDTRKEWYTTVRE